MKILILTNKLPYPPRDGGSIATLNMITGLRDAGNDITCLALNTSKHPFPVNKIPGNLSDTIRFIGIDCKISINPIRLVLNLVLSDKPYIAERFRVRKYKEKLIELLKKESFDLVQMEGPYPGLFLKEIHSVCSTPISMRAHNVEHLIWKRKADHEKSPIIRWYLRNMASRLESFELKVVHQSNFLVPISLEDEAYFKSKGYIQPTLTIPTGLSLEEYSQTPLPAAPSIFFIGALDWLPNQEGISWFLDRVFENLIMEMPKLMFHVAGRNAPESFLKRLNHKKIVYHGEVENARLFMQSYRVMVAPLQTGSGIRIKILEGMALGRPVVTTSVGIAGIPAEQNKHVMVADHPDLFKNQLIKLLVNNEETILMVNEARQLIKHNFDNFGLSTRLSQFFKTQV